MRPSRLRLLLCALALTAHVTTWAAGPLATVTILDGDATVLRGNARLALAEGVRLSADDLAETGAQTRLVRLEFTDGLIVDLGPDARLWMSARYTRDKGRPERFYLQQGWAKVTVPKAVAPAPSAAFSTPGFDITNVTRQIVVALQAGDAMLFTEAGEATLLDRKSGATLTMKSDQFLSRAGSDKPAIAARPTPAFIQRVPKPFLDLLPARADRFKDREVAPKKVGDLAWADAQPWIDGEPSIRPAFLARWKSLAAAPEFRKGLVTDERAHPEWDRVLHPEKYVPKPAPQASGARTFPTR